MRFLTAKDFVAGAMFLAFGALGLWLGADYRMGTAARMGAGYMPRLLCWTLVVLGAVIALRGILAAHELIDRGRWKPIVFITAAIIAFALLIDGFGLLIAGAVLILVGAFGGPEFNWRQVVPLAIALLIFSSAIFIWGLGLPITLLPR
jgi:putative tricarboxylic transport membrane protein